MEGWAGGAALFVDRLVTATPFSGGRFRLPLRRNSGTTLRQFEKLNGVGPGNGWTSTVLALESDPALIGRPVFGQWIIRDKGTATGMASTEVFLATYF
jgi:hypothetical protein